MAALIGKDGKICLFGNKMITDIGNIDCICTPSGGGPGPSGFCDYPSCIEITLSDIDAIDFTYCGEYARSCVGCWVGGQDQEELVDRYYEDKTRIFAGINRTFRLTLTNPGGLNGIYEGNFPARFLNTFYGLCETCSPAGIDWPNDSITLFDGFYISVSISCGLPGTISVIADLTASQDVRDLLQYDPIENFPVFTQGEFLDKNNDTILLINSIEQPILEYSGDTTYPGNPSIPCQPVFTGNQLLVGGGSALLTVPDECGELPYANVLAYPCLEPTGTPIVVDLFAAPVDAVTCIYNSGRYFPSRYSSFDSAVSVEWTDEICESMRIGRQCDDENSTVTYDPLTQPDDTYKTFTYSGNRYYPTPILSTDTPVNVTWETDECFAGASFAIATICRPVPSGTPDLFPPSIVYPINPGIGIGNGAVSLVVSYPDPACPDDPRAGCTSIYRYTPTTTTDPGPATPGVIHVAGTPCALSDTTTCRSCDDRVPGPGAEDPEI